MDRKIMGIVAVIGVILSAVLALATVDGAGVSPDEALARLKEGNAHFLAEAPTHRNRDMARREVTARQGQFPLAMILSCSDSRVPVEILFDQGVGDIFSVRTAGNVSGVMQLGSLEYGAEHLGARLLVVLGHSKCGAVTAVAKNAKEPGNIPAAVAPIVPVVKAVRDAHPGASDDDVAGMAAIQNVFQVIADIYAGSPVLRGMARSGRIKVVGAFYHIESGKVDWLGPHPEEARLVADGAS
ncbi:carbonic anhydrase [Desulfolutivibrio sulfoxidireducens]|uniref:carbonic anhydrase n=1 Tax=Desulfolutivibrio sulfoxidireducens TaxID=2773299 RepID=UPI00159D204D|nr:carbonic anhydrase [Desulfolutivibrio sulfoxidireducens]QLA16925.1 carbonic anhydrase [Desulfolutivibrio sulfoxidireducens]QLA20491.1 carbonic anhydrase [Desulfolutivibrio sulfoxidireducens]